MKVFISILILFISIQSWATSQTWSVEKGELVYHVNFPLKKIAGHSNVIKGKAVCNKTCKVLAASPITSFDSGDTNRDFRVLNLTEATDFPFVQCEIEMTRPNENTKTANVKVTLAGKDKLYRKVPIKTQQIDEQHLSIQGTLPTKLTDFNITPPSLLGVSIDDEIPVDFNIKWKLN